FTDGIKEELTAQEQTLTQLREVVEELEIEKAFNNMLYNLLEEERLNAKFLEAENFSFQEIYYRIEGRDEFLTKFSADNEFLRSIYEANKEKINLTDDQKQRMDDVYKNVQGWQDLKNTPENLLREKKY
ncbi:hypothetical protein MKX03_027951, partial [Papaver bracteatum]